MGPWLPSQPEMPSSEFLQKAPIGNLDYKKVMWVVVTNLRPIEGWNRRGHRQTMPKYIKIYQNQRLPVSFKSNIKRGHSKHFFRSAVRYWFYGWVGDLCPHCPHPNQDTPSCGSAESPVLGISPASKLKNRAALGWRLPSLTQIYPNQSKSAQTKPRKPQKGPRSAYKKRSTNQDPLQKDTIRSKGIQPHPES